MKSKPCPSCLNAPFQTLFDFGKLPRSGTFLSQPEQKYHSIRLAHEFCLKCGLIRRQVFEDDSYDYTHVSRSTARWTPDYTTQIAESFKEKGIDSNARIIEVGANEGSFLDVLSKAGFKNLAGIEPSLVCAKECESKGYLVEKVHLDLDSAGKIKKKYGLASVIICRHTLEHVPEPFSFLQAMRLLLADEGMLFIETPSAYGITHDLHGHELWDEHLHIFLLHNLEMLILRAGFRIDEKLIQHYQGVDNLLVWCKPIKSNSKKIRCRASYSHQQEVRLCQSFASRWKAFCKQIILDASSWPRPIVGIGASHPQSNYLLFTGLGEQASLLVDDDPAKIGHYVPLPQPVKVISTAQLFEGKMPGTVLLTAFGYESWMNKIRKHFASKGTRFIEPYTKTLPKP